MHVTSDMCAISYEWLVEVTYHPHRRGGEVRGLPLDWSSYGTQSKKTCWNRGLVDLGICFIPQILARPMQTKRTQLASGQAAVGIPSVEPVLKMQTVKRCSISLIFS
jgi:hypothetical protein